jgi:hypothetical protein
MNCVQSRFVTACSYKDNSRSIKIERLRAADCSLAASRPTALNLFPNYMELNESVASYVMYLKFAHEILGSMGRYNNVTGSWCYKTFVYSFVHECQQWIVVTIHVQQPHLHNTTKSIPFIFVTN